MAQLTKNTVLGPWTLEQPLGKGGNCEVWRGRRNDGHKAAVKVLCKDKASAVKRFAREVEVYRQHGDLPGMLTLFGSHIPDGPCPENPAWLAVPEAKLLSQSIDRTPESVIQAFVRLAETLAELHDLEVAHRDLKPDNLLFLDGAPCVGDFGLASHPADSDLTRDGVVLGPMWTIAPEMKRNAATASGYKADVYSLAKSLWILLTDVRKGFEGQYNSESPSLSLRSYHPSLSLLHKLDACLHSATAQDPDLRPTMREFGGQLEDWVQSAPKYSAVSLGDWEHVQRYLFPTTLPEHVIWTDPAEILRILNVIGSKASLNHTFHPDGGGLDLAGVTLSSEEGCLELRFETAFAVVIRPKTLAFVSFGQPDDWAYFRLDTESIEPTGVYDNVQGRWEEVLELSPGEYRNRSLYDQGFLDYDEVGNEVPLPEDARVVCRQLSGSFVIFAKASKYNDICDYGGEHDRMSAEEFRKYIGKLRQQPGRTPKRHKDFD